MILQLRDAEVVQIGTAAGKVLVMGLPCGNGIVVHAGGGQNGFPQLLDGLCLRQVREELLGPRNTGDGCDTPLILVLDLVAVRTDDLVLSLTGLGHLFLIDAAQTVRVLGDQIDAAGDLVNIVLPAGLLPVFQRGEVLLAAPADMELRQRLIVPVHHNALGTGAVAFLNDHFYEFGLIELGGDEDLLTLLDIDADRGDQRGIFAQYGLFHIVLLVIMNGIYRYSSRNPTGMQPKMHAEVSHCKFPPKRVE